MLHRVSRMTSSELSIYEMLDEIVGAASEATSWRTC